MGFGFPLATYEYTRPEQWTPMCPTTGVLRSQCECGCVGCGESAELGKDDGTK